jgi:hypothetical protein
MSKIKNNRKREPQELCNAEPLPQEFAGMKARHDRDMAIRARKEACYEACAGMEDPACAIADVRAFLREIVDATSNPNGDISTHGQEASELLRALGA